MCENVNVQLNHNLVANQEQARLALIKIIHCRPITFLARQGLPLRGHDDCEGNLVELLKLLSDDVADLKC